MMEDQMALKTPVTSRVPRRYMIHNLTGSTIFYSPSDIEHTQHIYQARHAINWKAYITSHVYEKKHDFSWLSPERKLAHLAEEAHVSLPNGRSEKLKAIPTQRSCELQAPDGTVITSYNTGLISIQFQGFW